MRASVVACVALFGAVLSASSARAQGWRLRLDSRIQRVGYTGVELDSIPESSVVTAADGSLTSPEGFAVECLAGFCSFFRPGPVLTAAPLTTTADAVVWGVGMPGVSLHTSARLGVDLGTADVWPGTSPAVQLIEGYAEYAGTHVTAQLGRTTAISRLGYTGFDGGLLKVRGLNGAVSVGAYGGFGLARGIAIPVTSPALTPLDDFQPRDRQGVIGADLSWAVPFFSGRAVYERQVSRGSGDVVSERAGADAVLRLGSGVALSGGADYDLAFGQWGTADASLDVAPRNSPLTVSLGARRYRPYFDLWTVWGAFSPVAYHAISGAFQLTPLAGIRIGARGESYWYDPTETNTPLVDVEDHGWRWTATAAYARDPRWSADVGYTLDNGPGANLRGIQAQLHWAAERRVTLTGIVATLDRPLEFRFDESNVWNVGVTADWIVNERVHLDGGITRYAETRDRPDPGAIDWNQWRLSAGVRWQFGSGADRPGVPPAVMAIPDREERK